MADRDSTRPRLSVIVPTCDRAAALRDCLAGLARQTLPSADFEVIVVDDSGNQEDVQGLPSSPALPRIQLIRHSRNSGAAAARNTGARSALAPFLAFVDDDCVPESQWAAELMALLPDSEGAGLAGPVRIAEPRPTSDRVTQLLSDPLTARDGTLLRAQTANLAVPADGFHAIGGFDESYQGAGYEDYEFCRRWRQCGRRLLAAPGAVVVHHRNTGLRRFWRQHFSYGRGAVRFYKDQAGSDEKSIKTLLKRLATTIGAGTSTMEQIQHLGWVGLSQLAMLAGYATERIRRS